ncbi:hypothetical protein QNM99_23100 [Pseudomonas sp. PCH446]
MAFPKEVDDGLTSAELTALGDTLDVIVSSYSTMPKVISSRRSGATSRPHGHRADERYRAGRSADFIQSRLS